MALRCALLLSMAGYASCSACTTLRGSVHGVEGLDPRRYSGLWFGQSSWGTGARAMSWCVACIAHMLAFGASHRNASATCLLADARARCSLKTVYTADPAPGVVLGVATSFRTPFGNALTLRGVKRATNTSMPSELLVFPDSGAGLQVEPTPSWIIAVGDAPDYGWAATGAPLRRTVLTRSVPDAPAPAAGPPTEESEHGCLPRERTGGLAIITRERAPSAAVLRQAKAALAMRGYDTTVMVPTRQDNCAQW